MIPWKYRVDIGDLWWDESLPFPVMRDRIIERIRAIGIPDRNGELREILEWLETADDVEDFDVAWAVLYDWADERKRLWIDLFTRPTLDEDGFPVGMRIDPAVRAAKRKEMLAWRDRN